MDGQCCVHSKFQAYIGVGVAWLSLNRKNDKLIGQTAAQSPCESSRSMWQHLDHVFLSGIFSRNCQVPPPGGKKAERNLSRKCGGTKSRDDTKSCDRGRYRPVDRLKRVEFCWDQHFNTTTFHFTSSWTIQAEKVNFIFIFLLTSNFIIYSWLQMLSLNKQSLYLFLFVDTAQRVLALP